MPADGDAASRAAEPANQRQLAGDTAAGSESNSGFSAAGEGIIPRMTARTVSTPPTGMPPAFFPRHAVVDGGDEDGVSGQAVRKVRGKFTDLISVTAAAPKTPAAGIAGAPMGTPLNAPPGDDLLGSIVREHLERASGKSEGRGRSAAGKPPTDAPTEPDVHAVEAAVAESPAASPTEGHAVEAKADPTSAGTSPVMTEATPTPEAITETPPADANDALSAARAVHPAAAADEKPAATSASAQEAATSAGLPEAGNDLGVIAAETTAEVQAVQREFEKLFEGDIAGSPREDGQPQADVDATRAPATAGGEPELQSDEAATLRSGATIDVSESSLSAAELDALLSQEAAGEPRADPAAQPAEMADPAKVLADAEGVLEQELLQLMAETTPAAGSDAPAARANATHALADTTGALEQEFTQVMADTAPAAKGKAPANEAAQVPDSTAASMTSVAHDSPHDAAAVASAAPVAVAPAAPVAVAPAAVAAVAPAAVAAGAAATRSELVEVEEPLPSADHAHAENSAAPPAAPKAPAGMDRPPPVVIEAPEEVDLPAIAKERGRWARDLALMAAQLFDLPFRWIGDAERYLVGLAAFLLLLGGGVLWVISYMIR